MAHPVSNPEGTDCQRLSERIAKAVATQEEVAASELTPLHDVLDPDALTRFCESVSDVPRQSGHVSFRYCGYDVTVSVDGSIDVRPTDQ